MKLKVKFSEMGGKTFAPQFKNGSMSFKANFGKFQTLTEHVGGDPYEGEYVVTPKVEAQTMPTKEKVMLEDVTIRAIPYFETSNTSGGNTVYIAKEI